MIIQVMVWDRYISDDNLGHDLRQIDTIYDDNLGHGLRQTDRYLMIIQVMAWDRQVSDDNLGHGLGQTDKWRGISICETPLPQRCTDSLQLKIPHITKITLVRMQHNL